MSRVQNDVFKMTQAVLTLAPENMRRGLFKSHSTLVCENAHSLETVLSQSVVMVTQHHLCVSFSGSEEGVVLPSVPWRLPAPGGVRLHGRHAPLSVRLHHHLHSAPQV